MSDEVITLDVREDIRNGRQPFSKIMSTVAALRVDQRFLLIAPFEPVPLLGVMKKQGFSYAAEPIGSGDWKVLFSRSGEPPAAGVKTPNDSPPHSQPSTPFEVDARGLEPPQPMVKILEALAELPVGAELAARTDRRPMHLYSQLEARGFMGQTEEQSDGSFLTHIRAR